MLILSDLYSDKTMEDFNLPLTKPVMNKIIQALGNNFAAWFTPSYTFLHLYIKFMFTILVTNWYNKTYLYTSFMAAITILIGRNFDNL